MHLSRALVALLIACGLVLVTPAVGSADTHQASPTLDGCSSATPWRLAMYSGGQLRTDVYVCTDWYRTRTLVVNTSRTHVWFLQSHTEQPYWLPDPRQPLRIQLFRTAMRRQAPPGRRPLLTFEPGTRVLLRYPPATVWLRMAPRQQAAWQTVGMAVTSARKVGLGAAPAVLGRGSPSRRAVVTCAVSAYKSTELLSRDTPARDLATALGLGGNAAACSRALDRASSRTSSTLVLESEDLSRTAFARTWLRKNRSSMLWSMAEQLARRAHR